MPKVNDFIPGWMSRRFQYDYIEDDEVFYYYIFD
jgi:hypothetical protein